MYRPQIATILALVALVSASPLLERISPDAAIALRAAGECEKTAATKQQSCVEACKEDTSCIRDCISTTISEITACMGAK